MVDPMDLDQLSLRTVLLQKLQDRIAKELKQARSALEVVLGNEGRRLLAVDNYRLGTASVTKKRAKVMTTDALLDWAESRYPDDVHTETVTTRLLTDHFVAAVKRATESAGEPCGPGGELDIPGVSLVDGYLSVRFADGADDAISYLWRNGKLNHVVDVQSMLED